MHEGTRGPASPQTAPDASGWPARLRADCARCFGLCCVVPAFVASSDFAVTKPAGQPCRNLRADSRCAIHGELRERGYAGCTAYDCFGAGQQVAQHTFDGRDWRDSAAGAGPHPMFAVFPVVRDLHELLWYLSDALSRPAAAPVHADLRRALRRLSDLADAAPGRLLAVDRDVCRREVDPLLTRASQLVRATVPAEPGAASRSRAAPGRRRALRRRTGPDPCSADLRRADLRRADLTGRDLGRADLRGADLRGASLLGADLRGADLRSADLIGADLRGADLRGADLTGALYLTRFQIGAARGGPDTRLPATLDRPPRWDTGQH